MQKIFIRASILSVMLILFGIVAFSLLFFQYYFSQKLALESTHNTFKLISKNITEHLKVKGQHTSKILSAKRGHEALKGPISFKVKHPALQDFVQTLQINPNLYAIYFAQQDGHFYEVVNMQNKPQLLQTYHAPAQTAWLVITIINNQQQLAFLDAQLEPLF